MASWIGIAQRIGTPYAIGKPFEPEAPTALVGRALADRQLPRPAL